MGFFTIPIHEGEEQAEELNKFLATHRIVTLDREFIQDGPNSAWALSVSYVEPASRPQPGKRGKIDYREILSETDFAVFARLRALRKTLADREGVPAYALFTNEQLAEMVQRRVATLTGLRDIPGVGEARADKHGSAFLDVLRTELPPLAPPMTGDGDEA